MRSPQHAIPLAVALILLLTMIAAPGEAEAQTCAGITQPPWPNGCSIGAPLFVQNGLNLAFLGACNAHDQCWAQCNGPNPPYLGLGHKFQCDLAFLAQMEAACVFWSGVLSYPGSGWVDADDFLDDCTTVAGVFFGAVNTPGIAFNIFWGSQCCRGCNPDGCANFGLPLPPLCGFGQCYGSLPIPPFPGPGPIPGPCVPFEDTRTWIVPSSGEAAPAAQQLGFDLASNEQRPESTIYLEEWAVVSPNGGRPFVSLASSEDFRERLAVSAATFAGSGRGAEEVMVVEAAVHERNARFAPTPSLVPFRAALGREASLAAADDRSFWFRAEVDRAGRVDQVSLLDTSPTLARETLSTAIGGNLALDYPDERRHRSVVFGRGTVDGDGVLEVESGLVVVSQCCNECCWVPEFEEWFCPCF